MIEVKSSTPTRKLLWHVFHRAGLLAIQQMKRTSENRWFQMVSEWAFKDIFQPGM